MEINQRSDLLGSKFKLLPGNVEVVNKQFIKCGGWKVAVRKRFPAPALPTVPVCFLN